MIKLIEALLDLINAGMTVERSREKTAPIFMNGKLSCVRQRCIAI